MHLKIRNAKMYMLCISICCKMDNRAARGAALRNGLDESMAHVLISIIHNILPFVAKNHTT